MTASCERRNVVGWVRVVREGACLSYSPTEWQPLYPDFGAGITYLNLMWPEDRR